MLNEGINVTTLLIREYIMHQYKANPNYKKCCKAKEFILEKIFGNQDVSF